MVFYPDPEAMFAQMKAICMRHGLEGVAPLDNQIGLEGIKPGKELVLKIVQADFALIDKVDGGLFCLDPFRRSTEMDAGTAVELGYMKAQCKPMAGWTRDGRSYPAKVQTFFQNCFSLPLVQTEPNALGGTSGALRDPDGALVHSEGMVQNGMTQGGIELAGGAVFCDRDWAKAFDAATACLAAQFAF